MSPSSRCPSLIGVEDRPPQKDLGDDRQEAHQRPERKVAAVHQPLFERNPEDRPPTAHLSVHASSVHSAELPCPLCDQFAVRAPSQLELSLCPT